MKNITLVVVMVFSGTIFLNGQYKSLEDVPEKYHKAIEIAAVALKEQNNNLIDYQIAAINSMNSEIFNSSDFPIKDFNEKFLIGLSKSGYEILKGKITDKLPAEIMVEFLENIYEREKNKEEFQRKIKKFASENSIIDIINNSSFDILEGRISEKKCVNEIAFEFKKRTTKESQKEFIDSINLMESDIKIFQRNEVKLKMYEMLIRAIHDSQVDDGGYVLVETDWQTCHGFLEWTPKSGKEFCTPTNYSVKMVGSYGDKIMNRVNQLMKANGKKSVFDLDIYMYAKMRVMYNGCNECYVIAPIWLPAQSQSPSDIPMSEKIKKSFQKGGFIPAKDECWWTPSKECRSLSYDKHKDWMWHAAFWGYRNKKKFSKFDVASN